MRLLDWLRARLAGHVSAGPRGRVRIGARAEWPSVEHFEAAQRQRHAAHAVDVIVEDEAGACWRGRPFLVWTWEPLTPEDGR